MVKEILDDLQPEIEAGQQPNFVRRLVLYLLHFLALFFTLGGIIYLGEWGYLPDSEIWFFLILGLCGLWLVMLCRYAFSLKIGDTLVVAFFSFAGALICSIFVVRLLFDLVPVMEWLGLNPSLAETEILVGTVEAVVVYSFFIGFWLELGRWVHQRFGQ